MEGAADDRVGGWRARMLAALRRFARQRAPYKWGLAMTAGCLLLYLCLYIGMPGAHTPGGDGFYTWLYARSLAFDGDVHFANDYKLCGDGWHNGIDRGTGRPDNPFYPGPSLFLAPVLWLLRHVVPLPPGSPPNVVQACGGPLPALTLAIAPLLGAASMLLAYRAARRFVSDGHAAVAAATIAVGGSILVYASTAASYSHVYAAACTSFVIWAAVRAWEQPESWRRWGLVALALFFCVFQRINLVSMTAVPVALAAQRFWGRWRPLAARVAVMVAGAALGTVPTLLLYKYLYGTIFMLPQGRYYVQVGHGHPFLLLFAPAGGMLFTTPAMWLPVLGVPFAWRRQRWLTAALLATAAFEIYIASCPLTWDGGSAYGARLLTSLTPIFVLLSAFVVAAVHGWLAARPGRVNAALAIALLTPLSFMAIGIAGSNHHGQDLKGYTQEGMYGGGVASAWEGIDRGVGDLSLLPAELLFSWRYGLPPQSFRWAVYPRTFFRDYKTMQLSANVLGFGDPTLAHVLRGFVQQAKVGARLAGTRGAIVFSAHWPYATRLSLQARAPHPVRLRVGLGRFYGTLWVGETRLSPASPAIWPSFTLPRGSFDSGLNEIVIECVEGPCAEAIVQAIRIDDDNTYAPALR